MILVLFKAIIYPKGDTFCNAINDDFIVNLLLVSLLFLIFEDGL